VCKHSVMVFKRLRTSSNCANQSQVSDHGNISDPPLPDDSCSYRVTDSAFMAGFRDANIGKRKRGMRRREVERQRHEERGAKGVSPSPQGMGLGRGLCQPPLQKNFGA